MFYDNKVPSVFPLHFYGKILCSLEQAPVSLTECTAHVQPHTPQFFSPVLQIEFYCPKTSGIITLTETLPSFVPNLAQEMQKFQKTT
jgi:hypothetical protein